MLLVGALLGLGLIWFVLPSSPDRVVSDGPAQTKPHVSAPLIQPPSRSTASAPVPATTPAAQFKGAGQVESGTSAHPTSNINPTALPELTRPLEQVQSVQMASRDWSVLGTKEVVNDLGKQSVLVLRDEISGQLEYRQSALRVVLRDGVDYETFISARPNAKRLFVNSLYGEIAVDAWHIGAEFEELASDPRVQTVSFIPLAVPPRHK